MSATTQPTGAHGVAEVIARTPGATVFGMPGGNTIQIFDGLRDRQDRVDVHLVREESLATVMAESYGRLTGRPAFVIGQGAWVLGNAGIGIMEAQLGSSPMVVLIDTSESGPRSHHGPYQGGIGGWGSYDLPAAMSAICKRVFVALDATQAVQMTQLAVKHAIDGVPGPVAVIFHSRAVFSQIDPSIEPPIYFDHDYAAPAPTQPTPESLSALANAYRAAQRPVIISGSGVRMSRAEGVLRELAELTDTPVVTSAAGKGTFPEDHALAGGVIGMFGQAAGHELVGDADFVLAVGTKLSPMETIESDPVLIEPGRQVLAQIDVEALNLSWTFPIDHPVAGDAAAVLASLLPLLAGFEGGGTQRVGHARVAHAYFEALADRDDFAGRDVAFTLSRLLPANTVLTCDAGENRLFMLHDYQSKLGGTVLQPNGGGGMGYAVPAAMGAVVARPGDHAVAVCGDGGFAMSLHGILSAHELGLNLLVVVMNNDALGWILHGQGERPFASEFSNVKFEQVSAALGANAIAVDSVAELEAALANRIGAPGVSVIVANTSLSDSYQDVISPLTTHDAEAVAAREPA